MSELPQRIPLINLTAQYHAIQPEIDAAVKRVMESGHFILGKEVESLEEEIAGYLGVQFAVGVASGTDALILALRALDIGPGDEVIAPAYTFFATIGAILHTGARPVLVDVDRNTYCIDVEQTAKRIGPKTKAVLPVHLYGHPADMRSLCALGNQNGIRIIEDNAQALGAELDGQKTGSFGHIGCLSFFPSKNLGAFGDAGMIVSDDPKLIEKCKMLRTHGWKQKYFSEILGYNSRLDALQAAVLRVKLPHLDAWNKRRTELAVDYTRNLSEIQGIIPPCEAPGAKHVYHLYVIRTPARNLLQQRLKEIGVESAVYYPVPPHLTPMGRDLGYHPGDFPISERLSRETLAIPLYPELKDVEVKWILNIIKTEASILPGIIHQAQIEDEQ